MSYQRMNQGDALLLRLQLGDGNTGKFPLAHVYDSAHAEVAGSPFNLIHIGNGLYANESFVALVVDHYDASYTVYSDSGHTTVDTAYNYETDSFDVYILGGSGSPSGCLIEGQVVSSNLVGEVIEPVTLTGNVTDC